MEKDGGGRQEGPRLKNKPTCHIRRGEGGGGEREEAGEEENKKHLGAHFMVYEVCSKSIRTDHST